jgi:predicted phosphodiesterase
MLAAASPALGVAAKNVAVSKVTSTSAVLVVKSDITSNVTIDYGQSSGIYTSTVTGTGAIRHELALGGLNGSSAVYYRITIAATGAPGNSITLPEKSFRTARGPGDPFSFSVAGDNRPTSDTVQQPVAWVTILGQMEGEGLDLVLNVGDVIYGNGSDSLAQNVAKWEGLFAVTTPLTYTTPFYIAAGNHERLSYANSRAGFEQEFTFPVNNGADAATYGEHYYSFDNGDTHFISLSTEIPGQEGLITGDQKAWLEADLAVQDKPWIIVFMHRPLFSGIHGGDPWVNTGNAAGQQNRAAIHSLFLQHGVDVVFEGHDHYYLRHEEDGIQYVITGGGGCSLSATPALQPGDVFAASVFEHVKVDETATSLGVSVIDSSGAMVESFTIAVPDLSLTPAAVYWPSYADYVNRSLAVEFALSNIGAGDVLNLEVLSLGASNGVVALTEVPITLGSLTSGSMIAATVKYRVPEEVLFFNATVQCRWTDERGFVHFYPGSPL